MFAAYGGRTMANAKFKLEPKVDPDVVVRTIEQIRDQKREQRLKEIGLYKTAAELEREEAIRRRREQFEADMKAVKEKPRDPDQRYVPTIQRVIERACRAFGLTQAQLLSKRRNRRVVLARQFVMYWARRTTVRSLPEIGMKMGDLDHTTVLHGAVMYPKKRAKMGRRLKVFANGDNLRLSRIETGAALALFRQGKDTVDIGQELGITEAQAERLLARDREASR